MTDPDTAPDEGDDLTPTERERLHAVLDASIRDIREGRTVELSELLQHPPSPSPLWAELRALLRLTDREGPPR
jgi:hypothetical protein